MAKLPLMNEADCSPEVLEIFDEIRDGFNCEEMSDYFLMLAHNEGALRSTWLTYKHILIDGVVPRQVKEMIFLAISLSRGCRYCTSSHLALCDMYQINEDSINSILQNVETLDPERMRKIILFSLKVANEPKTVTNGDYVDLQQEGLSLDEIIEILNVSTFCAAGTMVAAAGGLDVEQATVDYLKERKLSIGF